LKYTEASEEAPRVFADKQLTMKTAVQAIRLLMERMSIRSVCRRLKIGQHTLLDLLLRVGKAARPCTANGSSASTPHDPQDDASRASRAHGPCVDSGRVDQPSRSADSGGMNLFSS